MEIIQTYCWRLFYHRNITEIQWEFYLLFFGMVMFLLRCLEHENFSINGNYPDLLLKVVLSQKYHRNTMGILPFIFWNGDVLIEVSGTWKLLDKWKLSRLTAEGCFITEILLGSRERASTCDNPIAGISSKFGDPKFNNEFEDAFSFCLCFCCWLILLL